MAAKRLARKLHYLSTERVAAMDAIVIASTLVGTFWGAFVIQKAALEGLFRLMNVERNSRQ